MLSDGLTLVGSASIDREVVDASSVVTSLPVTVTNGSVVELSQQDGNNAPGLYLGKDGKWLEINASVTKAYDIASGIVGTPDADATVLNVPMVRNLDFSADFGGSIAKAVTAATAQTIFAIKKNGTDVGTIEFAAAATDGTFTSTGNTAVSFEIGDVMSVHAPSTADATLADIGYTFKGKQI